MKCIECKYWQDQGYMGTCKRYPETQTKAAQDWCGEYVAKTVLTLPVVTPEELAEAATSVEKRRGRPPKGEE